MGITIRFSDGTAYDKPGVINFLNVMVDRSTDTVLVRATIPNPDGVLIDGQLVRVAVQGDKPEEKVLVPQAALMADQQGTYVFTVQDGKATVRRVKLGGDKGTDAVIDDGLAGRRAGDRAGDREPAPRRRGDRDAHAARRQPELIRCSPRIFVSRPRLAAVIAIVTTIAGLVSLLVIPIAQYPDIVPPQVSVTTTYPGASAAVVEVHGRAADRKPGRRRRQDDLHEERERATMAATR